MATKESIDWASRETSNVVGQAIIEQAQENCSNSETEIEIIREALRIWQEPTEEEISMIYDKISDWCWGQGGVWVDWCWSDNDWCWGLDGDEWAWNECVRRLKK